jgi:hypothetical protein
MFVLAERKGIPPLAHTPRLYHPAPKFSHAVPPMYIHSWPRRAVAAHMQNQPSDAVRASQPEPSESPDRLKQTLMFGTSGAAGC